MKAGCFWRRAAGVAVALVLAIGAGCGESVRSPGPQPGDLLPAPPLNDLADGSTFSTASLRGTVLLVNFWATWCTPCRQEMASLETLSRRFPAQQVRVIGITMDADLNLAREFVMQNGLSFSNYSENPAERARDLLHVRTLPETLIVAADGRLVARVSGARDWASQEAVALLAAVARREPVRARPVLP